MSSVNGSRFGWVCERLRRRAPPAWYGAHPAWYGAPPAWYGAVLLFDPLFCLLPRFLGRVAIVALQVRAHLAHPPFDVGRREDVHVAPLVASIAGDPHTLLVVVGGHPAPAAGSAAANAAAAAASLALAPLGPVVEAKLAVEDSSASGAAKLSVEEAKGLQEWMTKAVDGVKEVKLSSRLVDSPAIVVGHESASMRRMMTMVESGRAPALPPQTLEINGGHPIIVALAAARKVEPEMASKVASQLFANALIAAGLLDDPRTMLPNVNALLLDLVRPYATAASADTAATAGTEKAD